MDEAQAGLPAGAHPFGTGHLVLALEYHAGLLVASVDQVGFLSGVSAEQQQTFLDALAGFYKLAGVHLVREQVAARLPSLGEYCITRTGLVPLAQPEQVVPLAGLLFCERPISWKDWTETWERDRYGKGHDKPLLPGMCLLPQTEH